MNGRARLTPQEPPKRADPLLRRLDALLPPDYDSLDAAIERALSREVTPGSVRPGQAVPSSSGLIAPGEFNIPRYPPYPPVVEQGYPPPPEELVGPRQEGRLSKILRQIPVPPSNPTGGAAPPRFGATEMPELEIPKVPGGAGSVAPWTEVVETKPPDLPDTRNKFYRERPRYRPDGQIDPMPQDGSFVRGFSDGDMIKTLPNAEQIEIRELERQLEESRAENFVGPQTKGQMRAEQMGTLGRTMGMAPGMVARQWQGILNVAELGARQLPTEGVAMGLRVAHKAIADKLQDWSEGAEEWQKYWMPEGGASFYDVLEDPTKAGDWAFPAMSQGLASTALLLGARAGGGPAMLGAAFTLNYPDLVDELEEAGLDRKQALEWGALAALPVSFFDTMLPEMIYRRVAEGAFTQAQGQAVLERMRRQMNKSMIRRTVEEAGKGAALEGLTEGPAQEGITFAAGELARAWTGEDRRSFEELIRRIVEAGAAGALPGAVFGAGTSINMDIPRETSRGGDRYTPREFLALEHEVRAAAGEYGEEGVPLGQALQETRIEKMEARKAKGIDIAPDPDFQVTDYEGPERRGDIDYGPPKGVTERRTRDERVDEFAELLLTGEAGKENADLMSWVNRVAEATRDEPGSPALRYAQTLAHQVVIDNRANEELIDPVQFLENFGRNKREVAPEEPPTGKPSPVTEPQAPTGDETQGVHPDEYTDKYAPEEILAPEAKPQTPQERAAARESVVIPMDPTEEAQVDVENLQTMEGAQYKRYGAQAASKGLDDIEVWNQDLAGKLLVWWGPPGAEFDKPVVINGHNRYEAALRLRREGKEVPPLTVRFIQAETLEDARAKGALTNIAEGRGTEWDAAEFFREGGYRIQDLREHGLPLREGMVNRGFALSKLIPKLYTMAQGGQLASTPRASMEKGVAIGRAGLTETEQQGLLKHFRKKGVPSLDRLPILLRTAQGIAAKEDVQEDLWGEAWVDESLLEEKTDINEAVEKAIAADARLSRKLLSVAEAAEEKGAGEIDVVKAAEIGDQAETLKEAFYVAQRRDQDVEEIIKRNASALREAKKGERNAVIEEAVQEILGALDSYTETAPRVSEVRGRTDREGGPPEGGGRVSERPANFGLAEEEGQPVKPLEIKERNGVYYVQYPDGEESHGFRDDRLAERHAERMATDWVPPQSRKQMSVKVGDNFEIVRNPKYAGQTLVSPDFAYAVLHIPTGRILDEGSFADMKEQADAYNEGQDFPDAADRTAAIIEGESEEGEVIGRYQRMSDITDAMPGLLARERRIQKKLDARKHVVRPGELSHVEELTKELNEVRDEIEALHKAQRRLLEIRHQVNDEVGDVEPMDASMNIVRRTLPDGSTIIDVQASTDLYEQMVERAYREKLQEKVQKVAAREREMRAIVTEAQTVYSAPTPLLNQSITLSQWMDRMRELLPKTKKGKVKRVSAVPAKGAENLRELQTEAEALFTHLAQNPLLIHGASREQLNELRELTTHPWFQKEDGAGAGNKPLGQKLIMTARKDIRTVDVDVRKGQEASWDPEKKQWYVTDGDKRFYLKSTAHKKALWAKDPLTQSILKVAQVINERDQDLAKAAQLEKTQASDEGPVNPDASIDMGGKYQRESQEDLFGKPKVVKLESPQMELSLEGSQRDRLVAEAHTTISNYYALWRQGQATERQMSHLQNAMKLLSVWTPESTWGFTQTDLNALDAHFGNLRGNRVKERLQTSDDQLDHYSLDPGGGVGFIDFYPSMEMPGAGQFNDDAKLSAEASERLRKLGLAGVFKKGIPSRREAVRNLGRALMTPITTGRTNLKSAFGRFYVGIRSIRTKWAYDMETVGHEVGHAIMTLVWGPSAYTDSGNLSGKVLKTYEQELSQFARDYEQWLNDPSGEGVPLVEAFAEWARRYITNRESTIRVGRDDVMIKDLDITKDVIASLEKTDPGVLEALDYASTVYKMFRNETPEGRILSQFQFQKGYKDDRSWAWVMVPPLARIKRAWIDMHVPFDTIVRSFNPGKPVWDPSIPLDENPALWARLMAGAPAAGDEAWMYGITDPETGERMSKGAEPVIQRAISDPMFGSEQEGFYLLTVFGAALRNIERAQVSLKRAQRVADQLNSKVERETQRFVVRESPKEAGAFDIYDLFTDKVVGRRFKQYVLGFSYKDSLQVVQNAKDGGYYDLFRETMQDLYDYADARLEYLVKMGVTTPEEAERIREGSKFYVPMVPVIERLDQRRAEYGRSFSRHEISKPPSAPRHMRAPGSAAPKRNWIEQLYIDNQYLHLLAMRHRTLQSLYELTKRHRGTAVFLEAIATPTEAIPVRMKQLINQLDQRIDSEVVDYLKQTLEDEGMASSLMVYLPGDYMENMDTVRVRDKETGQYVWLQVNDPELLGAMLGVEYKSPRHFIFRFLSGSAKALRVGATISPGFSLFRNPGRDAIQAWIMSEWGVKLGHDHVRAIYHMLGKDELYQKFLQSGAAFASLLDFDQKGIARKVQKAQRSKIANVVGDFGEALKILGTWTENMNRFAEYERAYEALIASGRTEMEARAHAAYAARDVTVDFWRHGYQTAGLRQLAAFWNANLQGWDKLARSARENPARFALRTFQGITLPSILFWMVNHDDEEYQSLPRWLRDFYWLIPVDLGSVVGGAAGLLTGNPAGVAIGATAGHKVWEELFGDELAPDDPPSREQQGYFEGTKPSDVSPVTVRNGKVWIKFPKPFFLGQLFGTTVERSLDYAAGEDGRIVDHLHNMLASELMQLTPWPTALRPIAELMTPRGYSLFQQRHIMSTSMAGRDRWTQYTPSTSMGARVVGEWSHRLTGTQGLSPVKLDHLLYSYFGTALRDVTRMTDYSIRLLGQAAAATGVTEEPFGQGVAAGKTWWQSLPLTGDLIQEWPYRSSANVDALYDMWQRVERTYNTAKFLQDIAEMGGDQGKLERYMRDNPGLFGEYYGIASAYAAVGMLNDRQQALLQNKNLTDKQRRAALAETYMQRDDLARTALEAYERANK